MSKILYTITDEAPALATRSLLPIVQSFASAAGVTIETRDISLAARILSASADYLPAERRTSDDLSELGALAKLPEANIIKLPNISASLPQLEEAIEELQRKGYPIPDYPNSPVTEEEIRIRKRYDAVKGSAVNPVLREGNSDRRAPKAVKNFARKNPHTMGAWDSASQTHVATMSSGDFRNNEISTTVPAACSAGIRWKGADGSTQVLKESIPLQEGEVIDASVMSRSALLKFLGEEVDKAKESGILWSLHLKATMMKVSDPIIFGHALETFFRPVFDNHRETLTKMGISARNGLASIFERLDEAGTPEAEEIRNDFDTVLSGRGPDLAMVNSEQGITNLHVPSDVIIDASMPAMIRNSGKMWDHSGVSRDTKAIIPDSSYADVYSETIAFCKEYGAFDPRTMGTVPNIGLMAQKAEEYGSHDKTFEIESNGIVEVYDEATNAILLSRAVEPGDIWRMCQVKDEPVRNWVRLAAERCRESGMPAVFWLDKERPHDAELIAKVNVYLSEYARWGEEMYIMSPREATRFTLKRLREGKDTISVTGNVLRDYLTDLFPILEVGTSAKMLSIVPLMNGGGLFETGAGGSAPKHVDQFLSEGHLRWDSLGEFLALEVSLEHLANKSGNEKARILSQTLGDAIERLLDEKKSPSRKVHEIDNRGSHLYLALYWAEALSRQLIDDQLSATFKELALSISSRMDDIWNELMSAQGEPVDIGGYYLPDDGLADTAMRPSPTLNSIFDDFPS